MIEALENTLKQIDKIESAIAKYTHAQNLHDMSRRHPISEDRNILAGEVFEARKELEAILSKSKGLINAAKSDAEDRAAAMQELADLDRDLL